MMRIEGLDRTVSSGDLSMKTPARRLWVLTIALVALAGVAALAQRGFDGLNGFGGGFSWPYKPLPNIPYDGRFTFVRVRYEPAARGRRPGSRPSWIHGYPLAERNLMKIMD